MLSVHQPFAWLIVNGAKTVENRSWVTHYRGPLLIHASKTTVEFHNKDWFGLFPNLPPRDQLAFGAIVGMIDVVDVITVQVARKRKDLASQKQFIFGPFCWLLANSRAFTNP